MKGLVARLLITIGIVLIIGAVLWWALAVNNLVKVPKGIDTRLEFEGQAVLYVNPLTNEFLPPGQELVLPTSGYLTLVSQDDEYSRDKAVISGVSENKISGQVYSAPYKVVIDRKNCFNVPDDRAYVFSESNTVDRSGAISYGWPIGTEKIDYPMWKEELAAPIDMKFAGEGEKDGLHVYIFHADVTQEEIASSYLEFAKLPLSMDFKKFIEIAKALGVDMDGLITLARQRFTPQEQETLAGAMAAGVPLKYYLTDEEEYSVDPKCGLIVDNDLAKASIAVKPDLASLTDLTAIFAKYAMDPVLGSAIQKLAAAAPLLEQSPGQTVMQTDARQTAGSAEQSVADARKSDHLIDLIKLYIPLALLVAGLILLLLGLLISSSRKDGKPVTHSPEA